MKISVFRGAVSVTDATIEQGKLCVHRVAYHHLLQAIARYHLFIVIVVAKSQRPLHQPVLRASVLHIPFITTPWHHHAHAHEHTPNIPEDKRHAPHELHPPYAHETDKNKSSSDSKY
jgi:hypothetical protein